MKLLRRLRVTLRLLVRWIVRRFTGRYQTVLLPAQDFQSWLSRMMDMSTVRAPYLARFDGHELHLLTGPTALYLSGAAGSNYARSSWEMFKYNMSHARLGIGWRRMRALGATEWKPQYTDRLGNYLSEKRLLKPRKKR